MSSSMESMEALKAVQEVRHKVVWYDSRATKQKTSPCSKPRSP